MFHGQIQSLFLMLAFLEKLSKFHIVATAIFNVFPRPITHQCSHDCTTRTNATRLTNEHCLCTSKPQLIGHTVSATSLSLVHQDDDDDDDDYNDDDSNARYDTSLSLVHHNDDDDYSDDDTSARYDTSLSLVHDDDDNNTDASYHTAHGQHTTHRRRR